VDFLLALIELFSLGVMAEALRAIIDRDYVSSHNYRHLTSHYPTAAVFVCIAVVQKAYVDTSVSALKLC